MDTDTWNIIHIESGESFDNEFHEEQAAYNWLKTMIADGKINAKMEDFAVEKQDND